MTYTKAELEEWVGRELTPDEVRFMAFLIPSKARVSGGIINVLVCQAYVWLVLALLDTLVPQSALDQVYGVGAVTDLPLREFTIAVHEEEDRPDEARIALSATFKVGGRVRTLWTTAEDVAQWMDYMNAFGITDADLVK